MFIFFPSPPGLLCSSVFGLLMPQILLYFSVLVLSAWNILLQLSPWLFPYSFLASNSTNQKGFPCNENSAPSHCGPSHLALFFLTGLIITRHFIICLFVCLCVFCQPSLAFKLQEGWNLVKWK